MVQHNHIYHGNSKEILKTFPDNYFHSIVTDPPYEIAFMGKEWDGTGIAYDVDFWKECLRVLRPGGHLASFSATSTYHKMTMAIEQAGFEIRDKIDVFYDGNEDLKNFLLSLQPEQVAAFERLVNQQNDLGMLSWIYGQGMPKGENVAKKMRKSQSAEAEQEATKWIGWNTSLKPANEPICLARKPLQEKTIVQNLLKHEAGALNIDGCRIPRGEDDRFEYGVTGNQKATTGEYGIYGHYDATAYVPHKEGRYPSNVMIDEVTGQKIDEQHANQKRSKSHSRLPQASRFFFCSKATKKERNWEEELLQIRSDLTQEQRDYVLGELKKSGIKEYKEG
ncbi:hypothetical protein PP175_27270 (plasmid) [Aneurinibacillus sp. Ricciae_BoGa-3]|uniref:hypothetical protein n=1 Tax=Aneurinibacillus sp. Ricciae_BoGa-3 TaxID=3022697 RepID=UPI00233FC9AD|nr:hypothetical protein [Aneurinibacillus sp. Ricciae_BoGa-3]WCK57739.1 hypothetical protein PP175_27270 [Aneurinibacillus sp. Ricciae_BoGa-3]